MIKALHLLKVLFLVFCLYERAAAAEAYWMHSDPLAIPPYAEVLSFSLSAGTEPIPINFKQPAGNSFSLDLGPSIIKLKTFYLETREEGSSLVGSLDDSKLRRYLNVFGTSSYFDGKLVGEGEFAYGILGLATTGEQPRMFRLGLKGRWNGISYGADCGSIGKGFVSLLGERFDYDRDEAQVWAERSYGSWRFRGTLSELWERRPATNELTLTKTAVTDFHFNRPNWSAMLSSSYSLIDQGTSLDQKTAAFANALSISYRPTTILTIVPKLSVREEWDQSTGVRTDTPEAVVTLRLDPSRDVQLTGLASYARGMSEDVLKDNSTVNAGAALHWRIGKYVLGEQFLSLKIEYRNEARFHSPSDSPQKLSTLISFKIVGF